MGVTLTLEAQLYRLMLEIIAEIFDLGVKNPLKRNRFPDGYSEFFSKEYITLIHSGMFHLFVYKI